jgi:hypothetical protein
MLMVATLGSVSAAVDQRQQLLAVVRTVIGAPFRLGAEGPTRFDCSGFVWYSFNTAGLGQYIGGKRMRAREYQSWFRQRGRLMTNARLASVGDLAFYGNPAKHAGIVTRIDARGLPRVTSALTTTGVTETKYNTLSVRFHSFARVGLGVVPGPSPDPTPTPTPTPTPASTPTASPTPSPTASLTPAPSPSGTAAPGP